MTTADEKMSELPPIERDEHMDRSYIPLPAGYEIQTKGKGSTFRIAKVDGERYPIPLPEFVHEFLTQMALDIREAWQASAAQYSAHLKELEQSAQDEINRLDAQKMELEQQNEQLQAQVAMLTDSLAKIKWHRKPGGSPTKYEYEIECMAHDALSVSTQTAEAYKRRVQAEALEAAAQFFIEEPNSASRRAAKELDRMAAELKGGESR